MVDPDRPDLCVIGAGAGGLSVAAGAAQLGARVILIEAHAMGGDCLNTGCVPSKALLAAAKQAHVAQTAGAFGVHYAPPHIDFAGVTAHVQDVISRIAPIDSEERFRGLGVDVLRAPGRFVDPRTVEAGGRRIQARRFVIATGSTPSIPPIAGLDQIPYLTNETIFTQTKQPEHLIILGGGPIGCEMAQAHRRLGSQVTVIDKGPLLPRDDPEAVDVVRQALVRDGIVLKEYTAIARVSGGEGDLQVELVEGSRISGTQLLVAAGRAPCINQLGLDVAGVDYNAQGILVSRQLKTSNHRIYALGDCRVFQEGMASPQFTHAAGYEAGIVIQNILFRLPARVNYAALPWVTYTDPEVAQVGLTQEQARARWGANVQTLVWAFHENDRAQAERRTEGKAIVVLVGRKIVGATLVGPGAGELIQTWSFAISGKLGLRDIAGVLVPYPTYAEINKRLAGSFFTKTLFSERTRKIVRLLRRLG